MPTFRFKATDENGKLITDTLGASSEKEAESLLRDKKLKILVLEPQKEKARLLSKLGKADFPLREKISLCRNLAILIEAAIPLGDAFGLLIENTTNNTVKKVLQDISSSLREGETISSGLARYPEFFDEVFLVMIRSGEASGTLSQSFRYLAREYKQEDELRQKVLSSLLYPIVIVALMVSLGILMLTVVLPKLAKSLLQLRMELPWTTKIILTTSLFLEKNLLALLGLSLVVLAGLFLWFKSKKGKRIFYLLGLKLPIFRKVILEYNLARFTRILSTLLNAGVPVTQALEISSKSLTLGRSEEFLKRLQDKLIAGVALSNIFREEKLFPPMIIQIVSVGEKTGNLEQLLADVSLFYQEEVENSLKNFIAILEPVLMIIVGVGIGIMVISIIGPIYSIISKIQIK